MFLTKHVASRTFRLQRLLQPRRCLLLTSRLHTLPAVSRVYTRRALFHHTTLQRKEAPTTLADPAHSDLHYHLIPAPNPLSNSLDAFALTFLPTPPAHSDSRTILGWLPAQSMRSESDSAGLNDFKENGMLVLLYAEEYLLIYSTASFLKILHEAIKSALVDDLDDIQRNGALQIQQGWMHINGQSPFLRSIDSHMLTSAQTNAISLHWDE